MALEKHGIIGQSAPAAGVNADVVPVVAAGRKVTISSLVVCCTGASTTYRVNARPAGVAAAVGNRLVSDVPIGATNTDALTLGITLGPTDVLTVQSAGGGVSFTAFGVEEDLV